VSSTLEATIYAALVQNEDSRRILELSKTPKTTEEIKNAVFSYKHAKYSGSYHVIGDVETLVGQTLAILEIVKAITFQDNKWKTTEVALSVLAKYFGI
jgi:hypothetical protein